MPARVARALLPARLRPGHARWLSRQQWRRRIIFWLGGVAVGLVAIAFAKLADLAQAGLAAAVGAAPYAPLLMTPLGFALLAALTRRFFPGSQGSGIPQAIAARQLPGSAARGRLMSLRLAAGKVGLTVLGLLVGASAGREGPTVQVGAAIMHAIGRVNGSQYQGMILAGAAAGISAAFNTPLAGIVFAIEELSRSFEHRTSGLVLTTVILAGFVSLALVGSYTYFGRGDVQLGGTYAWLAVPVCAVVGGLAGGLFSRLTVAAARGLPGVLGRLGRRPVLFAGGCGLAVAVIGVVSGSATYGTGYPQASALLGGSGEVTPLFGVLKLAATLLSTVSGIPGGIFSPSLAVGAGLGANLAAVLPGVDGRAVVLLGMTAYFAGVVQAPITAFVIILEMTGSSGAVLELMTTAFVATGLSRLVCPEPIYHALSRQFLPSRPPAVEIGEAGPPEAEVRG